MGLDMPVLETSRLVIRPLRLDDLDAIHTALDEGDFHPLSREARHEWLEWSVRNYTALANLWQPPYGERAITLRSSGQVIGAVGLAPALGPFAQLPYFQPYSDPRLAGRFTHEFGLYWGLGQAFRGQGYATEAARALIDYLFSTLNLARIVATTEYTNTPSRQVMERLGMRIETNPLPEPGWFQVVGILENPA